MASSNRTERQYSHEKDEIRTGASRRDVERIAYSPAMRRLMGVTQVVDASEGQIFHNRYSHTLEVARVGREIAEKILGTQQEQAEASGGLDPYVVEAAALAHDLGHPPFGHIGEKQLDELVVERGVLDGYNGNAQSFRIVTKLAISYHDTPGLNLTRATLNAILKYPWLRQTAGAKRHQWGAYHTEEKEFEWARESGPEDGRRSLEAQVMDWADDIAFSIHDVVDFYRAGIIPLEQLVNSPSEREEFLDLTFQRWGRRKHSVENRDDLVQASRILDWLPFDRRYRGVRGEEVALRTVAAGLTRRYVEGARIDSASTAAQPALAIPRELLMEVSLLKELTRHYVIDNPGLATQQYGKAKIVKYLFEANLDAIESSNWWSVLPVRRHEQLANLIDTLQGYEDEPEMPKVRVVADYISSLTDAEARAIHRRLSGIDPGHVTDLLPF